MRIGFLLGSGVSLPAGMPSTADLTKAVLRTQNYALHTDDSFCRAFPDFRSTLGWEATEDRLRLLLQALTDECQGYFNAQKESRSANYEDLFFAASQLHEHLSEDYENPAIEPFARRVMDRLFQTDDRVGLTSLANIACDYLRGVVAIELGRRPPLLGHLQCMIDAVRDSYFEGCDIFTLNHDLLIEQSLDAASTPFVDGFGKPDGHVAWWEPEILRRPSRHFLLKLHGSIDWARYDGRLAKVIGTDRDHAQTADGKMLSLPVRAGVLIGTFNKIRDYFDRPYFDLLAAFRQQMERICFLVVSGYSFGDKGVNTVLCEWMRSQSDSKMVILHTDPDQCMRRARGAIRNLWRQYGGIRMLIHPGFLDGSEWHALRGDYAIGDAMAS